MHLHQSKNSHLSGNLTKFLVYRGHTSSKLCRRKKAGSAFSFGESFVANRDNGRGAM